MRLNPFSKPTPTKGTAIRDMTWEQILQHRLDSYSDDERGQISMRALNFETCALGEQLTLRGYQIEQGCGLDVKAVDPTLHVMALRFYALIGACNGKGARKLQQDIAARMTDAKCAQIAEVLL